MESEIFRALFDYGLSGLIIAACCYFIFLMAQFIKKMIMTNNKVQADRINDLMSLFGRLADAIEESRVQNTDEHNKLTQALIKNTKHKHREEP